MKTPSWWWGLLRALVRVPLALIILFEEWGWEPLQRVLAWIGDWPGLRWIERVIRRLPSWAALLVFAAPTVLLLPIKLVALWLMGHGHAAWGVGVVIAAKVIGTAVVARLFTLTKPALMRMAWFARLYARWSVWKEGLLAWVRASAVWQVSRRWSQRIKQEVRRRLRAWFKR